MILRTLSIGCYIGVFLFLFIFARAFFFDVHDPSLMLVTASLVLIAIGLLGMIVHINTTTSITAEEKSEWRSSLSVGWASHSGSLSVAG